MCRGEAPAVEQFARDNAAEIQVVGVGAQDDFEFAVDFVDSTGLATPDMIWDPSFETWSRFGVRINSQMLLMSADLNSSTELFYGFGASDQQRILDALPTLG
ncbi:MAG: hypothetical protein R2707_20610 [Acidimicrobiales bacterium]